MASYSVPKIEGNKSLAEVDPEIFDLIEHEKLRQFRGLELIASENFTSRAVMDCLGSCLTNKYSEGLPNARYYGGNEYIDQIEVICQQRALAAFNLDPETWGVNVQPYSGSPANFAAYTAVLNPHERLMGLDLPSGGHLTHGYYTEKKKISATSIYFESLPYKVNNEGYIDYDYMESQAMVFRPKLLIGGGSAYPRDWDYARMRQIATKVGAYLLVDMAHYSGLVATGEHNNPFEHADIVTTTTHKSLRGPRAGMIFYRKIDNEGKKTGFEAKINFAVFPSLQGGPHNHQIAAIATQLREVATPEFKAYSQQVKSNARALAAGLMNRGHKLATNGTDNHLMLWDLRSHGIDGSKMQALFDLCSITVNKNSIAGDKSAFVPGGVRLGTPALTTRGFKEADFDKVAEFLHRGLQIGLKALALGDKPKKTVAEFIEDAKTLEELKTLRDDVERFATTFPMPGFDVETMKFH